MFVLTAQAWHGILTLRGLAYAALVARANSIFVVALWIRAYCSSYLTRRPPN